ncbi:MAG: hypothetical protein HY674_07045 [Chloroflexi bacterium]|nr:hypothetical protein [Chloroflexota bacterium]
MKTMTPFLETAPAAVLALVLVALAIEIASPPAWAAAPVSLTLKGAWPGHARGPARDVAVQGQYAYVAAGEGGLIIVDVSDPTHLIAVGGFDRGDSDYHFFKGIAVSGDYAYAADGALGLQVIDVSNPANPRRVSSYDTSGDAWHVALLGNYAYVADQQGGLQVIDISDPLNPERVGGADIFQASGVVVSGTYAYVVKDAQWDSTTWQYIDGWSLEIVDVSDPARPVLVRSYETAGVVVDVAVSGNHAYAAETTQWTGSNYVGRAGLEVIDVSDPANPRRVGGLDDLNATAVSVSGDYAYVGLASSSWDPATGEKFEGGLLVLNVSDPATPELAGHYDARDALGTFGYDPHAVVLVSQYAFLVDSSGGGWDPYEGDGLTVIDVSNPANPVRLGSYRTHGFSRDIAVSDDHAYITEHPSRLEIIDVSNPVAPVRVGGYTPAVYQYARSVAVAGNHAYVAYGVGLEVIDVSNPANPVRLGRYDTSGDAWDAAVAGNHAFVTEWLAGLEVIDVSNPANPVRVGGVDTEHAYGVAVSGNHAYVAGARQQGTNWIPGLQVIDVSNPANPVRVGGYDTSGYAVAVAGNYAYLAVGGAGLQVIDISDPANPVRVGRFDTSGFARGVAVGVAVVGDLIYMVASEQGLLILELSRPPWLEVSGLNPFTFRLSGEPGATLRVQRSPNLQDWEDWQTVTLGDAPVELSDPDVATTAARFFRAVQP